MRKIIMVLIALSSLALLIACGGASPQLQEIHVELDVVYSLHGDGRVSFDISTNLPDSTSLMLTLRGDDGSTRQTHIVIESGVATSELFGGPDNTPIAQGSYVLTVTMSLPGLQDVSVREVMGSNGEALVGDLVEESSVGGNIVRAEFEFEF